MPCNCDYMNPNENEKNLSVIYGLLDELKTGKLPPNFGDGYDKRVYNNGSSTERLNRKTKELCSALQKTDVSKFSLEMQIWWRDHQEADKKRLEQESRKKRKEEARKKALAKLTPYERGLLGIE